MRARRERRGIGGIECVSKGIIHLADASLPFSPIGTGASVVVVVAAMGGGRAFSTSPTSVGSGTGIGNVYHGFHCS